MLLTPRHQMVHISRIHQRRPNLIHIRHPSQPHPRLQLVLEDLTQMLHPLLPIAQTVQERAPDPHRRSAQRERLEHVRAPRDAPVDVDLAPGENVRADAVQFQQREQRRLRRVEGAAAVVRQHDALNAVVFDRLLRIRGALDPLDDNGQPGRLPDPGDVVPAQGFVNVLAHQPAHAAALFVVGGHGAADGGGDVFGGDAFVGFALAGDVRVDGDEDGFDAQVAGFVEELGGFGPVGVDVELEEEGLVRDAGFDDGGEGVGGVV